MSNDFNFELFETPTVSPEEVETIKTQKQIKKQEKQKKNKAIKIIGTVIISLLILVLIFFAYIFISPAHNPKMQVRNYISGIENEKWGKAYSAIYFDGTTLINKNDFSAYCSENPKALALTKSKITDYEIETDKISDDKSKIYFSINYICEDGSSGTFYLTAAKKFNSAGKLATYGILPTQDCFASLNICVPFHSTVTINGKPLEIPQQVDNRLTYTVNYIFTGVYKVKIENEFANNKETEVTVLNGNNTSIINLDINEETYNGLFEQTKQYIPLIYNNVATENEDFTSLPLFDEYKNGEFKNDIESIKEDVFSGNTTISNFTLTNATNEYEADDYPSVLSGGGFCEIELKCTFNYKYTYTYKNDDNEDVSDEREDSGYIKIKYILTNDDSDQNKVWQISGISAKAWF